MRARSGSVCLCPHRPDNSSASFQMYSPPFLALLCAPTANLWLPRWISQWGAAAGDGKEGRKRLGIHSPHPQGSCGRCFCRAALLASAPTSSHHTAPPSTVPSAPMLPPTPVATPSLLLSRPPKIVLSLKSFQLTPRVIVFCGHPDPCRCGSQLQWACCPCGHRLGLFCLRW